MRPSLSQPVLALCSCFISFLNFVRIFPFVGPQPPLAKQFMIPPCAPASSPPLYCRSDQLEIDSSIKKILLPRDDAYLVLARPVFSSLRAYNTHLLANFAGERARAARHRADKVQARPTHGNRQEIALR